MNPNNESDEGAVDLYQKNKDRGNRPFKTRTKVGERPVGLRQQRKAANKGSE